MNDEAGDTGADGSDPGAGEELRSAEVMDLARILEMSRHGHDVWVGSGPSYPWGGLYGGQIVAQGLLAGGYSVDESYRPHSVRAYFIRRGRHAEPVRYEVDRIRDGRSFCTRRVVARQGGEAILNLEASFQRAEPSEDIETVAMADLDLGTLQDARQTGSVRPLRDVRKDLYRVEAKTPVRVVRVR